MDDDDEALDLYGVRRDGPDAQLVADNMRRLRKAAEMSQGALAEAMRERGETHWRQTTVSRVENARQTLTMGEHRALEDILGPEVIAGTELQKSLRKFAGAVSDAAVTWRVQRLEELLTEAGEYLDDLKRLLDIQREGRRSARQETARGEHPEA